MAGQLSAFFVDLIPFLDFCTVRSLCRGALDLTSTLCPNKEKVYVLVTPANDPLQNMAENVLAVELPDWMADWDHDTDSDPPARCVFCEELEPEDSQSEPEVDELGAFNLVYVLRFPLWPFPELTEIRRTTFTLSRAGQHVTELQVFCCSDCYDMLMQAHHESAEPLNLREIG